jgi:hypothetical protein
LVYVLFENDSLPILHLFHSHLCLPYSRTGRAGSRVIMEQVYALFGNDSLPVQLFHSHCVYLIVALEGLEVVDFVQWGGISHPLQVESICRLTAQDYLGTSSGIPPAPH